LGLKDQALKKSNKLSGGQQQRVAIARAMINNPTIIMGDEPTGNLDPEVGNEIMKLFRKIHYAGTTILMATHNLDLIRQYPGEIFLVKDATVRQIDIAALDHVFEKHD
jgi:cell division transport system ATP-binding protein